MTMSKKNIKQQDRRNNDRKAKRGKYKEATWKVKTGEKRKKKKKKKKKKHGHHQLELAKCDSTLFFLGCFKLSSA